MSDDDQPTGNWLTDRDRWRRRIASAILVVGVALIVWWLSPRHGGTTDVPATMPSGRATR